MLIAKVIGTTISTIRDEKMKGNKFLILRQTDANGEFVGKPYVAVDVVDDPVDPGNVLLAEELGAVVHAAARPGTRMRGSIRWQVLSRSTNSRASLWWLGLTASPKTQSDGSPLPSPMSPKT